MKNKLSKALAAGSVAFMASPAMIFAQNKVAITQQNIDLPKGFFLDPGNLLNTILRMVLIIGVLLVFFFLIQGGLEWITSGGDKGAVEKARNKITNAVIGSTVNYAILFDAGSTGNFVTLANRSFVLSGSYELYAGIEERSTPIINADDFTVSAIGAYGVPASSGLAWRAQVNNTWDTATTNWSDATFGTDDKFSNGANVKFDDITSNSTVNISSSVAPGTVSFVRTRSHRSIMARAFSTLGSFAVQPLKSVASRLACSE